VIASFGENRLIEGSDFSSQYLSRASVYFCLLSVNWLKSLKSERETVSEPPYTAKKLGR
jgi:hypothetical protein